ncbi:hypothetical protein [Paracidovorax citrulli]
MAFCIAAGALLTEVASAQVGRPNLRVLDAEVVCQNYRPFVSLTLPVMPADVGRPGLLYVGMHDPNMAHAAFLSGAAWHRYQGGLFPVYSTVQGGLGSSRLLLPLNEYVAGSGWKLYVGYGALSSLAESRVAQASAAIEAAKAISPKAITGTVDADHYRRTLIQTDMSQGGKFAYVDTGVEHSPDVCRPDNSGG